MTESEVLAEEATDGPIEEGGTFAGDVLKLAGGITLAQALSLLVAPILSRLYAPDAFGTAAVFNSISLIVGVLACLRYELSIMLPERDEDAANLLAGSLAFVFAVAGLSAVLIVFVRGPIIRLLNVPDLAPYLWLVPLVILTNGLFLAMNYWTSRKKEFGRLSIVRMFQSATTNGAKVGIGVAGQTHAGGLIGSTALGSAVATTMLGGRIWRDDRRFFMRSVKWRHVLAGLKRHRKFPLFDVPSALLNTISWQLPALLLSAFFSSTVVGYHAIGMRVVYLPMSLVGSAIAQVFFQRAAEAKIKGDLSHVVENVFQQLVVLGLFPLLVLTVAGKDIFAVVFGGRWSEAGVYAQILSPCMFLVFTSSPMSTFLRVLERQQTAFYLNSVIFSSRFLSLVIGGYLGDARIALCLFSVSGALVYGWYTLYILSLAGVSRRHSCTTLLRYVLYAMPGLAILLGSQLLSVSPTVVTSIAVLLVLGYETAFVFRNAEMIALVQRISHRHVADGSREV